MFISRFGILENVLVSTTDKFRYEWIGASRNRNGIIIEVKLGPSNRLGPVHIALAEQKTPYDKMYRITVGDEDNTITWIGRGKRGIV